MNYSYCFLIVDNTVSTWLYHEDGIELICRDGLESFPFQGENDLLNWWKKIASYGAGDLVDLIVLTDGEEEWRFEGFAFSNDTVWSNTILEKIPYVLEERRAVNLLSNGNTILLKRKTRSKIGEGEKKGTLELKCLPLRFFSGKSIVQSTETIEKGNANRDVQNDKLDVEMKDSILEREEILKEGLQDNDKEDFEEEKSVIENPRTSSLQDKDDDSFQKYCENYVKENRRNHERNNRRTI